jgi:hypothetical protein
MPSVGKISNWKAIFAALPLAACLRHSQTKGEHNEPTYNVRDDRIGSGIHLRAWT